MSISIFSCVNFKTLALSAFNLHSLEMISVGVKVLSILYKVHLEAVANPLTLLGLLLIYTDMRVKAGPLSVGQAPSRIVGCSHPYMNIPE